MKKFLIAIAGVALLASTSEACVARGARTEKTKTVTRSSTRVGFAPVRTVFAAPFRAVGVAAAPFAHGKCPAPQAAAPATAAPAPKK